MRQSPAPCLWGRSPTTLAGLPAPTSAPQDPQGPAPVAATVPAVQAGQRQSRGGAGPWAEQCCCSSIPAPTRPLDFSLAVVLVGVDTPTVLLLASPACPVPF